MVFDKNTKDQGLLPKLLSHLHNNGWWAIAIVSVSAIANI
jgi:hypothetical protein